MSKTFSNEYDRLFKNLNAKKVVVFGGKAPQLISVLSFAPCEKVLYLPTKSTFNEDLNKTVYRNFDKIYCKSKAVEKLLKSGGNRNVEIVENADIILK